MPRLPDALTRLYDLTAPHYEASITPVMQPFAADLVQILAVQPRETALDVGTGTGVAARLLAKRARRAIGVDIVYSMLRVAQSLRPPGCAFLLQDAETLTGLAAGCCDAACASFGLAECDPGRALRAVARVLRPGGRFALQEWGPLDGPDDPRALVDDTLSAFATIETPTADPAHAQVLAYAGEARAWDMRLQDTEDYTDQLNRAGFSMISVSESRPVTIHFAQGIADWLAYTLAWSPRRLLLRRLPPVEQVAFRAAVAARLRPLLHPDGSLTWQPRLLRAHCVRKL